MKVSGGRLPFPSWKVLDARPAAMSSALEPSSTRCVRPARRARRSSSVPAARRTSTVTETAGTGSTARLGRRRRSRTDRTGDHGTVRHAACRDRVGARCRRQMLRSSAALRHRRHRRRLCRGRARRPAPGQRPRRARLRARRELLTGRGEVPGLRRHGDEERRRLRTSASCRRIARHPRRDHRGVAECTKPVAEATLRLELPEARAEEDERMGRTAAAISATAWHDGLLHVRISGPARRWPEHGRRSAAPASMAPLSGTACASIRLHFSPARPALAPGAAIDSAALGLSGSS